MNNMNFYERCIKLRNHYLLIDPNPLKLSILKELWSYPFYHSNYKILDNLPVGETINISFANIPEDLFKDVLNVCEALTVVLQDLEYPCVSIKCNNFRVSRSICLKIIA